MIVVLLLLLLQSALQPLVGFGLLYNFVPQSSIFTLLSPVTSTIPADNSEVLSVSYYCKMSLAAVGVNCLTVWSLGSKLRDKQQTEPDCRSASVFWPEGREQAFPRNLMSFCRAAVP